MLHWLCMIMQYLQFQKVSPSSLHSLYPYAWSCSAQKLVPWIMHESCVMKNSSFFVHLFSTCFPCVNHAWTMHYLTQRNTNIYIQNIIQTSKRHSGYRAKPLWHFHPLCNPFQYVEVALTAVSKDSVVTVCPIVVIHLANSQMIPATFRWRVSGCNFCLVNSSVMWCLVMSFWPLFCGLYLFGCLNPMISSFPLSCVFSGPFFLLHG